MKLPFFLARRFVAGETLDQAIPKVRELNEKNIHVTLDQLGENVTNRDEAIQSTDAYIDLIKGIEKAGLNCTISVKLTMMGLDINQNFCKDKLFRLVDTAKAHGQFVRIDMENSDYTRQTLDIFKEAHQKYGEHTGIVLQAYLHRTREDVHELADMGADVRLCKGAYKEPGRIALQDMSDIREAFKEYAAVLLDKTPYPRIATHDDELISWVKKYTADQNIDQSKYEFQMLYGLRQDTMEQLSKEGYNTRIYVPYGTGWFPYFKRRLMERKENIWFVLKTMFKK